MTQGLCLHKNCKMYVYIQISVCLHTNRKMYVYIQIVKCMFTYYIKTKVAHYILNSCFFANREKVVSKKEIK